MSKSKKPAIAERENVLLYRLERTLLVLTLVAVPMGATTGFSRFEVAKQLMLLILGSMLAGVWVLQHCRGQQSRRIGAPLVLLVAYALVLVGLVSVIWTEATAASLAAVFVLTLLVAVLVSAASTEHPNWVLVALSCAGVLAGLTVLLYRFGVSFPPAVPTGMAHDAGAHGVFDHRVFAGGFLAITAPMGLVLAERVDGTLRWGAVGVATLTALAAGISGLFFALAVVAVAGLGVLLSLKRWRSQTVHKAVWIGPLAMSAAAILGFVALSKADTTIVDDRDTLALPVVAEGLYDSTRLETYENAITSRAEWGFVFSEGWERFNGAMFLGQGLGTYAAGAGRILSSEHEYYLDPQRGEHYLHTAPAGALVGFGQGLGLFGLALLGVLLGGAVLAGLRGVRTPGESRAAGSGMLAASVVGTVAAALVLPNLFHAGEGVATMAVLGLGLAVTRTGDGPFDTRKVAPAKPGFRRFERWALVGGPVVAILVLGFVFQGKAILGDYQLQRAELFLDSNMRAEAMPWLERAVVTNDAAPMANYYLGITLYNSPGQGEEAERLERARTLLRRAAHQRPNDIRLQLVALRTDPSAGGDPLIAAGHAREILEVLRERDPRNLTLLGRLVDAYVALTRYEEALPILEEMVGISTDDRQLASYHMQIASLYQQLDLWADAADEYNQAFLLALPGSRLQQDIVEKVREVERRLDPDAPEDDGHEGHEH